MSQPLNREATFPQLGAVDWDAGEFWVQNPFDILNMEGNLSAYEPNRVYLNHRGETFVNASFASRANIDADSRSVIAGDFTGDGAPDLLVGSVGGGPLRLFRNEFPRDMKRLRVELEGTRSNRLGIGARVIIELGDRRIIRDVFPANGFAGQGPVELIVGLGEAESVDRLTVRWPTGETQAFVDLPIDSHIIITENIDKYSATPLDRDKHDG